MIPSEWIPIKNRLEDKQIEELLEAPFDITSDKNGIFVQSVNWSNPVKVTEEKYNNVKSILFTGEKTLIKIEQNKK